MGQRNAIETKTPIQTKDVHAVLPQQSQVVYYNNNAFCAAVIKGGGVGYRSMSMLGQIILDNYAKDGQYLTGIHVLLDCDNFWQI